MIKKKSAGGGTRDQQTIKKKYIYQHGGKRLGRSFEREKGDSRRRGRGMEVVSTAEEKEEGGHRKKEEKEGLRREGGKKKRKKRRGERLKDINENRREKKIYLRVRSMRNL